MVKFPHNPCTICYSDLSVECHKNCEDIILYKEYRNRINELIKQGIDVGEAVEIVNEEYRRK